MTQESKGSESLLKTIKDNKVEMIDLRFTDIPGLWQHFSVPPRALDRDASAAMMRELYDASTRSIFCFASATAISLYGAKVRSVDREMSGKSARVA